MESFPGLNVCPEDSQRKSTQSLFLGFWLKTIWPYSQRKSNQFSVSKDLSSWLKTIWPYCQRKYPPSLLQKIFNLLLLVDNYFDVIFQGGTVQGVEHRRQVDYKTQNENDLKFQIWINIVLQIIIYNHHYHYQIPITIIITIINIIIIIIITIIIIIKSLAVGLVAASWVFPPNPWWHRSWLLWQGGKCICICICDKGGKWYIVDTQYMYIIYVYKNLGWSDLNRISPAPSTSPHHFLFLLHR